LTSMPSSGLFEESLILPLIVYAMPFWEVGSLKGNWSQMTTEWSESRIYYPLADTTIGKILVSRCSSNYQLELQL
jgi:hypothetical protein